MKYVLAVSGGVDSMALLDMTAKRMPPNHFVVAHVDHGIRSDSLQDRLLVESVCTELGITCYYTELKLGSGTGEESARNARYAFLEKIRLKVGAEKIVTAHHADDYEETVLFNVLRGTGRRGISPFKNRPNITRPLLIKTKKELIDYAKNSKLQWREDSTNQDAGYSRNRIRHQTLPYLKQAHPTSWKEYNELLTKVREADKEITRLLAGVFSASIQRTADGASLCILQDDLIAFGSDISRELLLLLAKTVNPAFVTTSTRLHAATDELLRQVTGKTVELGAKTGILVEKQNGSRTVRAVYQP